MPRTDGAGILHARPHGCQVVFFAERNAKRNPCTLNHKKRATKLFFYTLAKY